MERVGRIARTLRNNWKKSVFGAAVAVYGISTAKERYEINVLMRAACEEAARYGDARIPADRNPKVVTVILNPVANKRSAKNDYEKYCEPILHLAGLEVACQTRQQSVCICPADESDMPPGRNVAHPKSDALQSTCVLVELVMTTSEGHAKEIVESLHGTEAIVVAGGDGTLAETVTGLLRRNDRANEFPLGVLPLGKTNSFGNQLFPDGKGPNKVKQLIEASMAVVKAETKWKDVMKIEPIVPEEEVTPRPIYALSSIEWGAFREAELRKDKYWITGPLRDYATFVFNGYKNSLTWNCKGTLRYSPPCEGCSNCVPKVQQVKSKWSFLVPSAPAPKTNDLSKVINNDCAKVDELCFKTSELKVTTRNIEDETEEKVPSLKLKMGKSGLSYTEFVAEGWKRVRNEHKPCTVLEARTFEILPNEGSKPDEQIAIDSEEFEVKPMKVTLLPKAVKLFCSSNK